jgi:hypothetical protein
LIIVGIQFDSTEDQTKFTDDSLSQYGTNFRVVQSQRLTNDFVPGPDALLFLMTTGQVLDSGGVTALQNYLNKGGNFIAIHAASDCLRNNSYYGNEVGTSVEL